MIDNRLRLPDAGREIYRQIPGTRPDEAAAANSCAFLMGGGAAQNGGAGGARGFQIHPLHGRIAALVGHRLARGLMMYSDTVRPMKAVEFLFANSSSTDPANLRLPCHLEKLRCPAGGGWKR